ncbi:STAS domain-containing protein [Rhodocytophaga aerolata]|jgi:anti-anti-sigma factor|uniref:Anti-sigma factor antagonist n=1 Tax=Rhodocytophaga aerolata TaxID=455078 RepID=A0ABT8R2P7_9BACT|nr:STAS domain-containing protein [Rhodocytophaga aerolata]MDO1446375.1 STAS domain-containing protein [Rhodocytophaga aerolata]
MKYSVDKQDKYLLIQLNETKVDSTVSPQLKSDFVTLNAEGNKNIILDMSQVKYIDSSGLSAILVGNRMANDSDGVFILTGITDHVMKLIKISQLDSVLDIMPTVQEAVDAVYLNELGNDLDQENR